jgi:alanine racemase
MTTSWTTIELDVQALSHNVSVVKRLAPHSKILAVVKSNAYGHGLVRIASALTTVDALGVARLEEAQALRSAGITKPIVLMSGFISAQELQTAAALDCESVVHCEEQIAFLKKANLKNPMTIWLKINTGLHRLGVKPEKANTCFSLLKTLSSVGEVRLMTHFSDADDPDNPNTQQQIDLFERSTQGLSAERSAANSAAILAFPPAHYDWVRPGIMLLGVSPSLKTSAKSVGLKPVMTLRSTLIAIHEAKKGEAIGYGRTWRCPEDLLIGVVGLGYGDGYPRHAKSGTPVLVDGVRCDLVGRVSMDMLTIDLRHAPNAKVGSTVVLWGADLLAEEIATCSDTIAYELFCDLMPREKAIKEK